MTVLAALFAVVAAVAGPGGSVPPTWNVAAGAPLRVWIQAGDRGARSSHAVRLAVAAWNAERLPVRFRIVTDSARADVHVMWTDRFDERMSGRTTRVDDGVGRITGADVLLASSHRDGSTLDGEELRALAMHELGHAMGLDHVNDATSIMAPTVRVRRISDGDRARVLRLYPGHAR